MNMSFADSNRSGKAWILVLLVLMAIVLNADNLVLSPNIDVIEAEFGVGDEAIGNISMWFTIIGAVVSLLWGYFGDKGSRKLLFVLSVVIGEIPCALTAVAQTWSQFYALRILCGIGVGASYPLLFSLVADIFDDKSRGAAAAWVAAAIGLGSIAGTVVGGFGGSAWGWRLPFFLVAAPNFLLALVFWFTVREPQRGAAEEGLKDLADQGFIYPRSIRLSDYRRLFTIPTNLLLFLQGISGCVPWGAIPLFLVAYLMREHGFTQNEGTLVFMVFGLGNILGIVLGGIIGGALYRKTPRSVPVFAGVTTIVGAFMAVAVFQKGWVGGFWPIVVLGLVTALMASLTGPNVKMMLMNVNVPENRAAIFSVFNLTDSLGTGIGRAVGGWLIGTLTIGPALVVSSLFWIPCGILLLLLSRLFVRDAEHLRTEMKALAQELAGRKA